MTHPLLNLKGHFALGLLLIGAGLLLSSLSEDMNFGATIAVVGMFYIGASYFLLAIVLPLALIVRYKFEGTSFRIGMPRFVVRILAKRARENAMDQILRYKQLQEAGVLSKEEYDFKVAQLKSRILADAP